MLNTMTAPAVRAGQLDELAPADRGLAVDEKAAGAAGGGELDVEAGLVVVPQGPADALVVPSVEQHGLDHDAQLEGLVGELVGPGLIGVEELDDGDAGAWDTAVEP
jgi:hypothetical protein